MVTLADIDMLPTGTGPNQLVKLDDSAKLPSVDASNLYNFPGGLDDIVISSPSHYDILSYNGTYFVNMQTGSGSKVQAWNANLDTIAGLSQGTGDVIRSNGTVWQSTKLSLNDLNTVLTTSLTTGDILQYNGTNVVNHSLSTAGIQPLSTELTGLAGLSVDGLVSRTTTGTYTSRTITGTSNDISVSNGDGVAGNPIIDLVNTAVTATSYGSATQVPTYTVDAKGRLTAASNTSIQIAESQVTDLTTDLGNKQPLNSNLTTIAGLSQGTNDVIASNGTNWVSTQLSLNSLSGVITTSLTSGNILYYNGTNFVNSAPGSAAGIQPYSATLNTIAGLSQGTGDVIRSNGTVWQSTKLDFNTDLTHVVITTPSSGDLVVYNGTNFVNESLSTAGIQPLSTELSGIASLSSTGIVSRTATGTYTSRTITGTSNDIAVTNGDGVAGNPTIDLINTAVTPGSYGSATQVPTYTVDANGRLTAASNTAIQITESQVTGLTTDLGNKQPLNSNLTTIAGLSQGTNNFIISNGTNWTSSTASLSQLTTPTADFAFGSYKITGLANPVNAQDAVTKTYVDAAVSNLNVHAACQAATTAALTATYTAGTTGADGGNGVGATMTNLGSLAALVIDGYSAAVNDRILVKNQGTATQNGIYVVTVVGSVGVAWVLTRASDYDNHVIATDVKSGDFTFIQQGSVNTATGWIQTGTDPLIVGTSNLGFTQFSSAGAYTAGTGLTLTGTQFSITNVGTAGTYFQVTTNSQGQVTSGSNPTTLAGFGITDAQGTSTELTGLAALSANGVIARTSSGTYASRTITGTASDISVTNGDGVSGNPTIDLINTAVTPGSYGSATQVAGFTVDANGRLTGASNTSIQITESQVTNLTTDLGNKQPLNSNLTTIAGLSQGTGDVIRSNGTVWQSTKISLNDINSVLTTSLTTGDVLYYNGTNVVNGAKGSASGVQTWNANLDTIAGLSQGANDVILSNGTNWISSTLTLNSISGVITTTLTTGDILQYNGTNVVNHSLVTAGIQPLNSNLTTIAGLSQGANDVILSNGTVWTSAQLSLNNLSGVVTTSLATGDLLQYNGTNIINRSLSTAGIQPLNSNLTTIAGLSQGTNNFIVSNGTSWTSETPSAAATSLGLGTGSSVVFSAINNTVIGGTTAAAGTFTTVTGARPVVQVTTTTKTLALTDANTRQECNNGSAQTITIPANSSVAFPVGTELEFVQFGAGKVTLAQGTGVTINSVGGNKSLGAQYAGATMYQQATNVWILIGNLIA